MRLAEFELSNHFGCQKKIEETDHVIFHPLLSCCIGTADATVARVRAPTACGGRHSCCEPPVPRRRGPGEAGWIRPASMRWRRRWPPAGAARRHDSCQRDAVVRANYLLLPLFAALLIHTPNHNHRLETARLQPTEPAVP